MNGLGRARVKRTAFVVAVVASLAGRATQAYDIMIHPRPRPTSVAAQTDQGPVSAADIDIVENLGERIPAGLTFQDGHHRDVAIDEVLAQGKPVIVTLGYYKCPMLCSLVQQGLAKAIKAAGLELGRDFNGVAVSINPEEKPKDAATHEMRLLTALNHPEADARDHWPFLIDTTPGAQSAAALAKAVGFRFKYDAASKQFAHAAVAFVLTPSGKVSRYLYGTDFAPRDLRFAVVEASEGRVGTTLDRILMTCFRYDPMVQRYTPYVFGVARIAGMATLLSLATLLAVLWRREMSRRRRFA